MNPKTARVRAFASPHRGELGSRSRRGVLAALGAFPLLSACGGGGSGGGGGSAPAPELPVVDSFAPEGSPAFVGDTARLLATYRGGAATLLPGNFPIASGVPFTTGVLAQATTFTLRVQSERGTAERSLALQVPFRDRYALAPSALSSSQHTASNARDGALIVIGGSRGLSTFASSVDRFDPATRTFRAIGSLAAGRAQHRATALASGGILVTGGLRSSGDPRVAERVDDLDGSVVPMGAMSVTRVDHAAVLLADGRVLVCGGYSSGEGAALGISGSAELWDPARGTFRRLAASMLIPRTAHSATVLPGGQVLIAGGYTSATSYRFAEVFDPASESFTPVPDDQPLRANHAAHLAPDGRVLLVGGEAIAPDGQTAVPIATALAYDSASGRLASLPALARPRTWAASVMLPSGELLLFGGQEQMPNYTASAERYDPRTGGVPIAALDGERALHSANRLPDGRIAVIGGEAWGGAYCPSVQVYE